MYEILAELDCDTAVNVVYFFVRLLRHRGLLRESGASDFIKRSGEASAQERQLALRLMREIERKFGAPLTMLDSAKLQDIIAEVAKAVKGRLANEVSSDATRARKLLSIMRSGGKI